MYSAAFHHYQTLLLLLGEGLVAIPGKANNNDISIMILNDIVATVGRFTWVYYTWLMVAHSILESS